jgi:hypothetical protein
MSVDRAAPSARVEEKNLLLSFSVTLYHILNFSKEFCPEDGGSLFFNVDEYL